MLYSYSGRLRACNFISSSAVLCYVNKAYGNHHSPQWFIFLIFWWNHLILSYYYCTGFERRFSLKPCDLPIHQSGEKRRNAFKPTDSICAHSRIWKQRSDDYLTKRVPPSQTTNICLSYCCCFLFGFLLAWLELIGVMEASYNGSCCFSFLFQLCHRSVLLKLTL